MKGNGIKIAIVAVCLVTAGVLFYRNVFGEGDVPPEYKNMAKTLPWYKCTKCGLEIQVKPEQLDTLQTKDIRLSNEGTAGLRTAPKMLQYIECPTCKDFTALFCNRCDKHELVYYAFNVDGTRGACPKCAEEVTGSGG